MKPSYTHSAQDIALISDRLIAARKACSGLSHYPGELPQSLETAYRIQDLSMTKWHDQVVGWKVGGIPEHLQAQFRGDRLTGPIYAGNVKRCDGNAIVSMPVFADGYAAIEAEFIIQLGDTTSLPDAGITQQQITDAIDKVFIGVEIASSPVCNINDLGPVAPISDFGNNGGMIVGPEINNWKDIDFSTINVSVGIDGKLYGPSNTKPGLGGPLGATKFLIEQLRKRGHELATGAFVSSGAITGVHDAEVGAQSIVTFSGLGTLALILVSNKL